MTSSVCSLRLAPSRWHCPHLVEQSFVKQLQFAPGDGDLVPPARLAFEHIEDTRVSVIGLVGEIPHHRESVERVVHFERLKYLRLLPRCCLRKPAARQFLCQLLDRVNAV